MSTPETPWLVAAWPGMGKVGALAAYYLVEKLGAELLVELPAHDFFEPEQVEVRHGLVQPPRYPRLALYGWEAPAGQTSLRILLAESQPSARGYALCEHLLARTSAEGVARVVTFAAMATPLPPGLRSRVFALATQEALLQELRAEGVELLDEGAVRGLNGVLLAAAHARGIPALCLLGEFPYFANAIPQPKAAASVLRVFRRMAGIPSELLDLSELEEHGRAVEAQLIELAGRLEHEAQARAAATPIPHQAETNVAASEDGSAEEAGEDEEDRAEPTASATSRLDPAVVAHIEALFAEAARDRERAFELKALLDQHQVFKDYEDRFLDLFRAGE